MPFNMDETLLSSPDPLGDSSIFISPPKPRTTRARSSLGASPKKQTFELDVGNELSPQKIRVTVEAGEDIENTYTHHVDRRPVSPTPSRRPISRRERTTTTTIPVKGLSDTEIEEEKEVVTPKRGRGRPRKNSGTPVAAKKKGRAGTPVKKGPGRRKSIGTLVDGDDSGDGDFNTARGVDVGRGKGRSRSRSVKGKSAAPGESSTSKPNKRGRRKSLVPEEVTILADQSAGYEEPVEQNEEHALELSGVLSTIDHNTHITPSAYSTIRSTTTTADDYVEEPDIILAVFDPDDATPRKTGWSSPRTADGSRLSSSIRRRTKGRSPSLSSEQSDPNSLRDQDLEGQSPEKNDRLSDNEEGADIDNYHYHGDENDEEAPEFDTILESEGFSMISVDSVPSLRKHLSSPAVQENPTPAGAPRNKSLLSIRDDVQNDSFSSVPAEVLEAATPARPPPNQRLLSVQQFQHDDSFSSIPPEILEAATPAPAPQSKNLFPTKTNNNSDIFHGASTLEQKSHVSKLLSKKNTHIDDSFSSIPSEVLEAATPRPVRNPHTSTRAEITETNENSFSAIPSPILDEMTPGPAHQFSFKPTSKSWTTTAIANESSPSIIQSSTSSGAPPRLPTPEDTPSPIAELSASPDQNSSTQAQIMPQIIVATGRDPVESSFIGSQMRSSPPSAAPRRYTYGNQLGPQPSLYPNLNVTPLIEFSSPSLPPPLPQHPFQLNGLKLGQRPALSPIARTGRALQDLIIPSSPRNRAQSLGSPFKSPMERKSSSVSRESQKELEFREECRVKPLPKLDLERHLFSNHAVKQALGSSMTSHSQSHSSRSSPHSKSPGSSRDDDPFEDDVARQSRSPSPAEKQAYSLEMPSNRRRSDPNLLNTESQNVSLLSENAMSWQADINTPAKYPADETPRPSSNKRNSGLSYQRSREGMQTWEHRCAEDRAPVSQQTESSTAKNKAAVLDLENERQRCDDGRGPAANDDEDYSLLLETINSSSPQVQQQPEFQKFDQTEKPRRSKLPSPWRKNSQRLVYSDELSQLPSPQITVTKTRNSARKTKPEPLTIRRATQDPDLSTIPIPQKSNFAPRVRSGGDFDLSALLASPTKDLPVLSDGSSGLPKYKQSLPIDSSHQQMGPISTVNGLKADEVTPTQESFTPIPQKIGFRPRVRSSGNFDISTLLNSPPKKLPVLSSSSQTYKQPVQQYMVLAPSPEQSSQPASSQAGEDVNTTHESSPMPEMSFTPVPQKMGFKPHVRERGDIDISEKLTTSVSKPSVISRQPSYTSPRDRSNNQSSSATAPLALAASNKINFLPTANHTPEVSSSPLADESLDTPSGKENLRLYDRTSEWCENVRTVIPELTGQSPTKSILRSPVKSFPQGTPGKTVAWVSSSPTPSEEPEPLSATEWSRDHWLLLDKILDNWKPAGWARDPTCPKIPPTTPSKRRRSFSETRVVSKLLGKVVTSQGERMRLEQWHLEAVDEWREEVPGWEEAAISIRLFSLIIGRERRANGTENLRNEMRARGEDPDAEWKAKAKKREEEKLRAKSRV